MESNTRPLTRHRALRYAAPAFAGLLLLGACSKKDDTTATSSSNSNTNATSAPSGSGSSSDTKVKGTTPGTAKKNQSLDQSVWFQGWKIDLGTWTYDDTKEVFAVDITVENLSSDQATYYGDGVSLQDSSTVITTASAKENPNVVAKSKAKDVLEFSVSPDKWTPEQLSIVFGSGTQQQAKVPLNGSAATTLKPIPQDSIKGALPVGNVTLTPDVAEVRYDNPSTHTQADKGKVFLAISGKAKNNSTDATYYTGSNQATLTLLDGSKQQAADFTLKEGSLAATQTSEFQLWFNIPDPYAGDYTLVFAAPWGTDSADATATVNFTLVKATTATTSGTTPGTTTKK